MRMGSTFIEGAHPKLLIKNASFDTILKSSSRVYWNCTNLESSFPWNVSAISLVNFFPCS